MSKAFTKEDVDLPERFGRVRSPSGLPPGAVNYITAVGAERLRQELAQLKQAGGENAAAIAHLEETLTSVTVVPPPAEPGEEVAFGALITVKESSGQLRTHRIVGVDELRFYDDAVGWVSPLGRKLLAAKLGQRLVLADKEPVTVVSIEYPTS
ncbi:hypothetical protein BH20VER2_BH20VER2_07720 [soil metagenome]